MAVVLCYIICPSTHTSIFQTRFLEKGVFFQGHSDCTIWAKDFWVQTEPKQNFCTILVGCQIAIYSHSCGYVAHFCLYWHYCFSGTLWIRPEWYYCHSVFQNLVKPSPPQALLVPFSTIVNLHIQTSFQILSMLLSHAPQFLHCCSSTTHMPEMFKPTDQ